VYTAIHLFFFIYLFFFKVDKFFVQVCVKMSPMQISTKTASQPNRRISESPKIKHKKAHGRDVKNLRKEVETYNVRLQNETFNVFLYSAFCMYSVLFPLIALLQGRFLIGIFAPACKHVHFRPF